MKAATHGRCAYQQWIGDGPGAGVGMPKDVPWHGKTVHTGIWKEPVAGPRMVRRLDIDGDGQGDLRGHGGEQRAVLVYQVQPYEHWRQYFGRDDLSYGAFGENLAVDGLPDDEVCIGYGYRRTHSGGLPDRKAPGSPTRESAAAYTIAC